MLVRESWRSAAERLVLSQAIPPFPVGLSFDEFAEDLGRHIHHVFQPILNIHTGACYGLEALLRGHDALGFANITDLFDFASSQGFLHRMDLLLRDMAIARFMTLRPAPSVRLFLNLDNRILDAPDYAAGGTLALLKRHQLSPHFVCFEITEHHEVTALRASGRILESYRGQTFRLAIDDFGAGHSGLKLLYEQHPDFIKVDRFFVSGIAGDNKKKVFVSHIVNLAHVLGVSVVAEGVETESELLACKDIGCDFVQGYLVQRPTAVPSGLLARYDRIGALGRNDRRAPANDARIIDQEVEALPALRIDTPMSQVFEVFRRNKLLTFFPVLDVTGEPLGLIRERDLKEFTYSPFGRELISNPSYGRNLERFVTPCPTADIRTEAEKILEIFSLSRNSEGILITTESRYVGFLSAASLLRVVNEKNLAIARDQNPLTKLPGNNVINRYISDSLIESRCVWHMVYFDFDNFKPFNDTYGFRQGDRAILLFAELLRKTFTQDHAFVGHVGGDDFVAGLHGGAIEDLLVLVAALRVTFASDVESFYDADARRRGGIVAKDRDGQTRLFNFLTVSAAVIMVDRDRVGGTLDDLMQQMAELKKSAKASSDGISYAIFVPPGDRGEPGEAD